MYNKRRPAGTLSAAVTTRAPLFLAVSLVLLLFFATSSYLRPVDNLKSPSSTTSGTDVSSSSRLPATNPGSVQPLEQPSTSSVNAASGTAVAWVNMSAASRLRALARGSWQKLGDATQYGVSAVSGSAAFVLGNIWWLVRPYTLGAAGLWLLTLSDTTFALLASVFVLGYTTYVVAPQFILNSLLPFVWGVLWFLLRNPMCIVMLVVLRLAVLVYSAGRSLIAGYGVVATFLQWLLPGCPTEASAVGGSVTHSEFEKFKSEVMEKLDRYQCVSGPDLTTVKTDA
jgi:hypothetical protein